MRAPARDLTAVAAFLALAVLMATESCSDVYRSTSAGVAHDPVFYPRIVIAAIVLLSLAIGVRALLAWRGADAAGGRGDARYGWRLAAGLAIACCGYVALMPVTGFLVATLAFSLVAPVVLGLRDRRAALLVAVGFPAAAWVLFAWVIRIPLPEGAWPWMP